MPPVPKGSYSDQYLIGSEIARVRGSVFSLLNGIIRFVYDFKNKDYATEHEHRPTVNSLFLMVVK